MNGAVLGRWPSIVALAAIAAVSATPALGGTGYTNESNDVFGKLLRELTGLFVVATVMESALALLFQWCLYREFFNGRAVKTVVMIAVGYAVVTQFGYDIFDRIVRLVGGEGGEGGDPMLSKFLSACVLAGGSAAVFELFKGLGLRPPVDPEHAKPKPPSDRAWVSVKVIRKEAVGDIKIHIIKVDPSDATLKLPRATELAGIISDKQTFLQRFKGVFLADPLRLPAYGGLTVEIDKVYRVYAEAIPSSDETAVPTAVIREIYLGRFAGRAIIDLVCTF